MGTKTSRIKWKCRDHTDRKQHEKWANVDTPWFAEDGRRQRVQPRRCWWNHFDEFRKEAVENFERNFSIFFIPSSGVK